MHSNVHFWAFAELATAGFEETQTLRIQLPFLSSSLYDEISVFTASSQAKGQGKITQIRGLWKL